MNLKGRDLKVTNQIKNKCSVCFRKGQIFTIIFIKQSKISSNINSPGHLLQVGAKQISSWLTFDPKR